MEKLNRILEEIRVSGAELADKVKALLHEGNVSRLMVRNEAGQTVVEIPITVAAVGAVLAPEVAALGALAALAAKFTIVVEKTVPEPASAGPSPSQPSPL
ncbi:MAG: DUF4342 domain-containing protein [Terriglobia bacterium]